MTSRLLKPAQVLERLPVSRATLYRMIRRGELTVVQTPSGRFLIPESAVAEWIASNTIAGGHEQALKQRSNIRALPAPRTMLGPTADSGEDLDSLADKLGLR